MAEEFNKGPFLTIKEAAQFLRVHHRTLDNWRWAGKGPRYRKHGKRVVYLKDDLVDYSGDTGSDHALN